MSNLNKQLISWLVSIFLIILSIFLLVGINQKLNTATTTNTVSFDGEGKVLAKPDIAVINLSIVTQAASSKDAQGANSRKSKTVVDFLKKNGVVEKDIKTTGYNIYPQYVYPRPVPLGATYPIPADGSGPKISGYQVVESLEVKVRDLEKASDILDGVVAAGANQVGSLKFEIDNPEKLKAQARQMAINDAKKKADELKSQLGIRLGRIINFTEGFSGYPQPLILEAQSAKGGAGGGPEVPSGENEITVDVTITYQIK